MPTLQNLSRPSNAVLRCPQPVPIAISGDREGTRRKYINRRCRECWQCVTSIKNDIIGRLLAEMTICARVDLLTVTYSNATVASRLGAKMRIPRHIQLLQKAMRQQERRGLRAYNKQEKKLAIEENREPELVPTNRSYIKFYPVFEYGGETGRGHWHILIMYESHFATCQNVAVYMNPIVIPPDARRVWYLPEIRGAETPGRPPDANNPDVIDWRCRQNGQQYHRLWPHGRVNFKCLTQNLQAVDYGGNPITSQLPRNILAQSCSYLLKYLMKPSVNAQGERLDEGIEETQTARLIDGRGGSHLYRTGSMGIGHGFAIGLAKEYAALAVPLNHAHFRIEGAKVPRSHASLAKYERKMRGSGLSEIAINNYLADASKMVFQMQGGMLNALADTYNELMLNAGHKIGRLGDVGQMRLRQTVAKTANEWLRSPEAKFRRKTARNLTTPDLLWANRELEKAGETVKLMTSGLFFDHKLPQCILPSEPFLGFVLNEDPTPEWKTLEARGVTCLTEAEKAVATQTAVKLVGDAYRRIGTDRRKYLLEKERLSRIKNYATPFVSEADRSEIADRDELHLARRERAITEEWEAFLSGDGAAAELLTVLENLKPNKREPLPAWAVVQDDAPAERLLRWLNHSEQFLWPKNRSRHIERYCAVRTVDKDTRAIITPDGRVLGARRWEIMTDLHSASPDGYGVTKKNIRKWLYREITERDLAALKTGKLAMRGPKGSDEIFVGVTPFKNTWAMHPNALQKAVLALPHVNTTRPYPQIKRVLEEIPF